MTVPAVGSRTTFSTHGKKQHEQPRVQQPLAQVYRDHVQRVARWAARLAGPGLDVEDIVHDVFLVVQRKLDDFEGGEKLGIWLYRITLHVVQAHRRRAYTRQRLELVYEESRPKTEPESPAGELEKQRQRKQLYAALDGLREEYRSVLILFEVEGFSGEEVAEILDVPVTTVWVWLQRARKQFLKQHNRGAS